MNYHTKARARVDGADNAVTTFGEARRAFIDAGIDARDLLPVIPPGARISSKSEVVGGKTPGQYDPTADNWRGLRGSHFTKGLSDDTLRDCSSSPTGNVGVRGAAFPAIDSDVRSHEARRLVGRVTGEVQGFDGPEFAIRRRGKSPRELYAFRPHGTVRSRPGAVKFALPGDKAGVEPHVVEIIGAGKHWVAAGVHPSGEAYGWDPDADFVMLVRDRRLIELGEADVDRILDELLKAIEAAGGAVLSVAAGKGASGNGGELRNFRRAEPVMVPEAVFRGLDRLPNTEANFPTRESLVGVLGAVRAALGSEAEANEDRVREWAVDSSEGWCREEEDFETVWRSLDAGVRAGPDSLYRMLHSAGALDAADDFPDDEIAADAEAENVKWEASTAAKKVRLLGKVAKGWRFKTVNMRTDDTNARVRIATDVESEEVASQWWDMKTTDALARVILPQVQKIDGWKAGVVGLWQFLTDLKIAHPDCFYTDECFHPLFDIAEMVPEDDAQGNRKYKVNVRPLPEAQKLARRMPVGSGINHPDTDLVLKFIGMVFGRDDSTGEESVELRYELDTLAFMLQSGKRPGNMLVLQGDSGTGKSAYSSLLSLIFDGAKAKNLIPGSSLVDENAARFAWGPLRHSRILQLQELPATKSKVAAGLFDSKVKTIVDASEAGDFVSVELKNKDAITVENHARIIVTTNFEGTVDIGEQDRRIFLHGQSCDPRQSTGYRLVG